MTSLQGWWAHNFLRIFFCGSGRIANFVGGENNKRLMKKNIVFISWHSDKQEIGKKISKCFRDCFGNIFGKEISVFASHVDIKHGWTKELSDALYGSKYGIILLTPQALDSAWMYYEFGVLRRIPEHVWCFPFGNVSREKTPFSINQYLEFSEEELKKMLDLIIKKELSDNVIGWDECISIRKQIETEVPKLYSEVNKIAADIDNDYERNYIIREKYFQMIKNVKDITANQRIIELEAEVAKYKKQLILNGNTESEKDKKISQKVAEIATLNTRITELESELKKKSASKYCDVIDLGLPTGTLWADRNIGASSPEEAGYYFAWGEIEPKNGKYDWNTYRYNDNPKQLPPSNDAATQNWDSDWRMPTKEQFDELLKYCEWKWDGKGYKVIGKNGNSIYIPAAGYRYEKLEGEGQGGLYWSSSLREGYTDLAWSLYFSSVNRYTRYDSRHYGFPVRAVWCKK